MPADASGANGAAAQSGVSASGNAAPSASGANGPQGPPTSVYNGRKKQYKIRHTTFTVDPHYDVIKAIGIGAYGLVCSAKDSRRDRFVAIKKIPKLFDDLVDAKRVLRELKIMRHLGTHPNIIELYEVLTPCEDTAEEQRTFRDVYLVEVLMDTDLHQVLKSKQRLSFEHHAYFTYQMLRGISYIHSAGVIHRDLKPGNLLLDHKCELRICDFGLARGGIPLHPEGRTDRPRTTVQPHELTDYVITRWYRPPELLLMAPYHHGVDMWSVGCIMAEILLRRALLQGRDYMHQMTLIAEIVDIPTSLDDVQRALPNAGGEQCRYVTRLAASARQAERAQGATEQNTKSRLFTRFQLQQDRCSNTWQRVMDLISSLLVFDASARLSAYQALRHRYLAHLFKEEDDIPHERRYGPADPRMWEFDHRELSEADLRQLFWDEMKKGGGSARTDTDAAADGAAGADSPPGAARGSSTHAPRTGQSRQGSTGHDASDAAAASPNTSAEAAR